MLRNNHSGRGRGVEHEVIDETMKAACLLRIRALGDNIQQMRIARYRLLRTDAGKSKGNLNETSDLVVWLGLVNVAFAQPHLSTTLKY
jgi:hypothetical protein